MALSSLLKNQPVVDRARHIGWRGLSAAWPRRLKCRGVTSLRHQPPVGWVWMLSLCVCVALSAGCASDSSVAELETPAKLPKSSILQAGFWKEEKKPIRVTEKGEREYAAAERFFQQEKYDEAESAFQKIAKAYKDTSLEEDAFFMIAECQFLTKRYPTAQDSYEQLLQKYPNSRHLDKAAYRQFTIGKTWLDEHREAAKSAGLPLPNLTEDSRPLWDLSGRAIEALDSVVLHDPTGPLADDAVMLIAGHHFASGQYESAEQRYDSLRELFPNSEHQGKAHLLGARAKLRAYQGADYDQSKLDEAARLLRAALRQFPELEEERPGIFRALEAIRAQEAEGLWESAEYYRRSRHPRSAAVYYDLLIQRYPDTKWAELARAKRGQTPKQSEATENTEDS